MKKLLSLFMVLSLLVITACDREKGAYDELAQCITDSGAIMYGADNCSHCKQQKALFKGSFDLINYVECRENKQACIEAGIEGFPTWSIDGELHDGVTSLTELAGLTRCKIRPSASDEDES